MTSAPTSGARAVAPLTFTDFGLRLFQAAAQAERGNLFVSPVSAGLALATAFNAAAGDARAELARALGLGDLPAEAVNEASRALMEALAGARVELAIANSLWIGEGEALDPALVERVRRSYAAHVASVDFGDEAAIAGINRWVHEATRGQIPTIAARVGRGTLALLLNAVYFKGSWTAPFDARRTAPLPFRTGDGRVIQHPSMRRAGHYAYVEADGLAALELPYGDDGRFALYALLPAPGAELGDLVRGLTADRLEDVFRRMETGPVSVTLPRFRLRGTLDLEPVLRAVGVRAPFTPGAFALSNLFPPRAPRTDVYISQALQQTVVEVNEEGTTAAALTEIAVERGRPAPDLFRFTADRPFLVLIRDGHTGAILFIGQVNDPSAGAA